MESVNYSAYIGLDVHKDTIAVASPELWKVMNEKSRNNVYFKRKRDFKAAIDQFFAVTLPENAGSLTSRINDNFQILKLASSS
ncbi:transposase [Vibrio crassostreae]|uniref:Transposase n=1 Tax=Vibrio crassostreae TaxID=246167 RepID=A0A4R2FTY6_9VIBR|nr:hypothetical protein [Vibrio crassostreae]ROO50339.1 hypothetical protein EDB58_11263 [Vibrio crassostreae]TCL18834.1 hypothetical protein EDB52_11753 [Vibrio crassostreae]TCN05066.1 hypothetical protein EDB35_11959 [Vibrio crassostreae]TCN96080.1 hypothetical protein EDB30_11962 [Vibrio crassostreae]